MSRAEELAKWCDENSSGIYRPSAEAAAELRRLDAENAQLRAELETERMRLAACGVVAMSNTPESAKRNREMKDEYWSASCQDVASMVDREMELRAELEAIYSAVPVAEITSWTNGSYWRNYKVNWIGLLEKGTKLIPLPERKS